MSILQTRRTIWLVLVGILLVLLSACSTAPPRTPTDVPATEPVLQTPVISPTPEPTDIPTQQPARAILWAPDGADSALAAVLEERLSALAGQAGLEFEVLSDLTAQDLDPNLRVVLALSPAPGLGELAGAAPATQFVVLGESDLQPSANLSLVSASVQPDQQGFLAGFLAAVLTPDWRVGVISQEGMDSAQAARQGFINGVVYYCGLCRPAYPPYVQYPLAAELPAGASQAEQQAAADSLLSQGVKTVYVASGAADEFLLEYLGKSGAVLIGGAAPPDAVQGQWIASIQADLLAGVEAIWPQLVAGQGGHSQEAPLLLTDRNENLFSPGRQRLVDEFLADLIGGYIDTGVGGP